jgi:heptose-I-phosphate ethanolaminephosphotransferase
LPTLVFYAIFIVVACFLEAFNFSPPRIISSWLILASLLLSIELIALSLMKSLPKSFRTGFSSIYHIAIAGLLLGIIYYNLRFGVPVSAMTMQALLQTNLTEAQEFLSVYANGLAVLTVVAGLLVIIACSVARHRGNSAEIPRYSAVAIAIVAATEFAFLYKPGGLYEATIGYTYTYYHELAELHKIQALRRKSVLPINAHKSTKGETYVLVIGESENRNHMRVYGYPKPTTPWLDQKVCQPNWIIFRNAHSNHTHTVPTLSFALTSANQYNGQSYYSSPSIFEVAKAAGFRTYYLSNQQTLGEWSNPISAIASTADVSININANIGYTNAANYFDSDLVERFRRLKSQVDSSINNLIVFHLLGSHIEYCRRYPQGFGRFGSKKPQSALDELRHRIGWPEEADTARRKQIDCYDNSVAFTDFVLSQIFAEAKQLPGFRAFVYLSDHADAVDEGLGHDADRFSFAMTHIPMVVALSDAFVASHPRRVEALRDHTYSIWTNDLLYDLLIGLMGVDVDSYNSAYDLSSPSYILNWKSALTLHGRRKLKDDPEFASAASGNVRYAVSNVRCEQQ